MITGNVNAARDAMIHLRVRGPNGHERAIEAVIDTGFNDWLILPPKLVNALALVRIGQVQAMLADGSEKSLDIYQVTVIWDAQTLIVEAGVADSDPLIGMALLEGYELRIQVVDGGDVTIRAL